MNTAALDLDVLRGCIVMEVEQYDHTDVLILEDPRSAVKSYRVAACGGSDGDGYLSIEKVAR